MVEAWEAMIVAGKVVVANEDFAHDVWLYVSGDFDDQDAALEYAGMIAAKLNATHPQPVTPAGGEVVLTGWTKADGKTRWMEHDGLPVFNEGKHDDLGTNKAVHLYEHPPVADAALPRGHRVDDGKQLAMIRDAERYRWLRNPDNGEGSHWTVYMSADELDAAIDAALNQRGGLNGTED